MWCPTPRSEARAPRVSVIVPTLNEARTLGATLDVLTDLPGVREIIVVDGGSEDKTVAVARAHGVRLLHANRGRGPQMHAGAQAALGDILWFVHADTHPPPDATHHIETTLARPDISGGCFAVRFDSTSWPAYFLAWLYARLRRLNLCYGDATLFVRRGAYEQVGGFRPFPLFEDVELAGRLRQCGRFLCLPVEVITSARRFEGHGFVRSLVWWMTLQLLYWLGLPPRVLARMYAPIRSRRGGGPRVPAWSSSLARQRL
jgi:rSAM/selenodomain-associated transferase 2